jgi:phage shock protein A
MGKMWSAFAAQINKMANWFWTRDPIAQMQLEYDRSVAQLKEGREGLEQYRALVERVTRQVALGEKKEAELTAKIKAFLKIGDRNAAGQVALQLKETQNDLAENRQQLGLHEQSYQNNVEKIKFASKSLAGVRERIKKHEANLKMSEAEAQIAKLSESFNFNVTTDFGEIEQIVEEKIDLNRAKVRVAADMSGEGLDEIKAQKAVEAQQAEDLLSKFEVDLGLKTQETANIAQTTGALGPEQAETADKALEAFEKESS